MFGSTSTVTFGGVDEVRGDVTPVKLHALNDLQLIVQSLPILRYEARIDYLRLMKHANVKVTNAADP